MLLMRSGRATVAPLVWPIHRTPSPMATQMMHADHAIQRLQKQVDELKESATGATFESAPFVAAVDSNLMHCTCTTYSRGQCTSASTSGSVVQRCAVHLVSSRSCRCDAAARRGSKGERVPRERPAAQRARRTQQAGRIPQQNCAGALRANEIQYRIFTYSQETCELSILILVHYCYILIL